MNTPTISNIHRFIVLYETYINNNTLLQTTTWKIEKLRFITKKQNNNNINMDDILYSKSFK